MSASLKSLVELMKESGLNRNQLSQISGVSNTYLAKIEKAAKGGKQDLNVGRQTLINIGIGLNLGLIEINDLLKEHGYDEISKIDAPAFLSASEKRVVSGMQPIFDAISFDWLLVSVEKTAAVTPGASIVLVSDKPSAALMPSAYARYRDRMHEIGYSKILPIYEELLSENNKHRRKLCEESLFRGNRFVTYICKGCLRHYMNGWKAYKSEKGEQIKAFTRSHIETLIRFIEQYPDHYRFNLIDYCGRLKYEILYLPSDDGRSMQYKNIFFIGRGTPCKTDMAEHFEPEMIQNAFPDLIGFASDSERIMKFFHMQVEGIKSRYIDSQYAKTEDKIEFLKKLMRECELM